MKLFYVTLNNQDEAKIISHELLSKQLAVCTNWFPINCMYRWENEIKSNSEVVLIIKTKENMREVIEKIIQNHINYGNFIAELAVHSVNDSFLAWLNNDVKSNLS